MTDTFARMRQLIGSTAEWAANDLVIGLGEFAIETIAGGTSRLKVGDGVKKFSELGYFDPGIFDYVLTAGDTMTGPLVVPGVTVNADGLIVSAGSSSFAGPVSLGPTATAGEPAASDNSQRVATTHWVNQQVGGIITGLNLKGTWNASTNAPPLASGGAGVPTPVRGDFYLVSVAGTTNLDGISTWNVGDTVVFNGFTWQRVPQTLFYEQIVAGLGFVPASDAELDTLDGNAIKRQVVDAAGDLIVGTAADAVARLARGTSGQVLIAGASGISWAPPPGWRKIGTVGVAAATTFVSFENLPTDVNHLMAFYDAIPVTSDDVLMLQMYDAAGVLDATPGRYPWSNSGHFSSQAVNAAPFVTSSTSANYSAAIALHRYAATQAGNTTQGISGNFRMTNIRDATRAKHVTYEFTNIIPDSAGLCSGQGGGQRGVNGLITGVHFKFATGGNIKSGSSFTLWGAP